MLKPLKQWYCDVCHQVIEKPEDGYVIWNSDDDNKYFDFKIIHTGKCDIKSYPCSSSLEDFLGLEGVTYLLCKLSVGPIQVRLGRTDSSHIRDMTQFVDLFRRVQVPYYEEARIYFNKESLLEDFDDDNEYSPYLPTNLKKIIEKKYEDY